jgi:uncharacterized protein YbjT (DUF2867 family)
MILIAGGTGFIGKALIRRLVEHDYPVRVLIRPSPHSPPLPIGLPVEVALSSLEDERGLSAAMSGVDILYHLISAEWRGAQANLLQVDILGTQALVRSALEAGVKRIIFLSHLGADRASAFPLLKAKAIAESHIRRSGLDYTILRSGIVFGADDHFTTGLARLFYAFPFLFFVPGDGKNLLQPLWVEDLATCLTWAIDNTATLNQTLSIGGPEFLTFNIILQEVMSILHVRKLFSYIHPPYLRWLTVLMELIFPNLPISVYWLDYLAANRTCSLDTIPRIFNLIPSRFGQRLEYLKTQNWESALFKSIFRRRSFS